MSLVGPLPLEVPSFQSLKLPFDNAVWIMTLAVIPLSAAVLSLVDIMWVKTTTKRSKAVQEILEGSVSR